MAQLQGRSSRQETLLSVLNGETCTFCDDGTLVRGVYKGNWAAVCDTCGVPGVQVWNPEADGREQA